MSKQITLGDAASKFGDLVAFKTTSEAAIQEAIDRIYEMGRWPGTTKEIEIAEADFIEDAALSVYFLYFDEDLYDGAIGFRNEYRGWGIVDHTALYKEGVNLGDKQFVDYGPYSLDVANDDREVRKYRCPLGWSPTSGPYWVLFKLEAPELAFDDVLPIQSLGALKAAIQAVSYESVNDDERATLSWQKFDLAINLASRQNSGPKKYFIGIDSSLKRKPKQFM